MRKAPGKPSRTIFAIGLALIAVTVAVYSQVRNFDFIIYDDPAYVTLNQQVKDGLSVKGVVWAFTSSQASNWHPLTWLSLMLDCELFGPDPHRMHLTNLLLHTANSILLLIILVRMTKSLWASAFVAFAFALHPLHIQSAAWIAERKDVLSALFWFLTMLVYLRYADKPSIRSYLVTLLVFVLGLMAKPMLVTLPIVLILLDWWPLRRFIKHPQAGVGAKHLLMEKIPFFILSAISSVITVVVQQRTGAVKDIAQYSLIARVANAMTSYINYIVKMFWPARLSIFYPHPGDAFEMTTVIICGLLLIAITAIVIWQARSRGYLFVGWVWYIVTLLPVIGIIQVGNQAMADRYTYIPLIGLFIIVAWGLPELLVRFKPALAVAGIASVIAMSAVTYVNLGYWQNSITVLEHAIDVTENNRFAEANLGVAYLQKNMYDQAIGHLEKSLQYDPNDAMSNLNIGVALFRKGKIDEAIIHFEKSRQSNPRDIAVRLNLGVAMTKQGRVKEAIEYYDEVLQIDPCNVDAINSKQKLLMKQQ